MVPGVVRGRVELGAEMVRLRSEAQMKRVVGNLATQGVPAAGTWDVAAKSATLPARKKLSMPRIQSPWLKLYETPLSIDAVWAPS